MSWKFDVDFFENNLRGGKFDATKNQGAKLHRSLKKKTPEAKKATGVTKSCCLWI